MAYIPLYQQNPSTKPTYANLGNGIKENDPIYPPSPIMAEATEYNEMGGAIEAHAIMSPLAALSVTHTSGTYTKVSGKAVNKNFIFGTTLTTGDVTIVKNGTGDLTFTFTAGIIPNIQFPPIIVFQHTTISTRVAEVEIVSGRIVRVRIANAGSASDAIFTMYVMLCRYSPRSPRSV